MRWPRRSQQSVTWWACCVCEEKVFFYTAFASLSFTLCLCCLADDLLTENEYRAVCNTLVLVEGGGLAEADGEYSFATVKNSAGQYERRGAYEDQEDARFTMYKCSLKNGGYQWFLSVTPDGVEPGTSQDIDLYYAQAKFADKLPCSAWHAMNSVPNKQPPPRVECIRLDGAVGGGGGEEESVRYRGAPAAACDELSDSDSVSGEAGVEGVYDMDGIEGDDDDDTSVAALSGYGVGHVVVANDDSFASMDDEDHDEGDLYN